MCAQGSFFSNIMNRSELAYFPLFTYANFIRHLKQLLTTAKLILNIFPNSLGTGTNSITEGDTRLRHQWTSYTVTHLFLQLCINSKKLHLATRLMEQHPTQQHNRTSYLVWNITVSKKIKIKIKIKT